MTEVSTIGLDVAKQVFHAHGADAAGATVFSRRITRQKLIAFFASQPRCTVAMEACAGSHHWGRELMKLGHEVRLIPPAYVKPFVKRQKSDAADAIRSRTDGSIRQPCQITPKITCAEGGVHRWKADIYRSSSCCVYAAPNRPRRTKQMGRVLTCFAGRQSAHWLRSLV